MHTFPEIETDNLTITVLQAKDFQLLVDYQNKNAGHLSRWEPIRAKGYFSEHETRKRIEMNLDEFLSGNLIPLVALNKQRSEIICLCTFSNIARGAFQACNLGYSINEGDQGKGLMFEMLQASINYVFNEHKLHRIMANYIPSNTRSENLLLKLGFEKEGLAKSYLKIAGSWQDHVLTSKLNPR